MPKQVDHENRRRQIAEATWRVISTEGMEHATVRKIAKEARLSLGALRHYFSNQDELLEFSMQLVVTRVKKRMKAIYEQGGSPEHVLLDVLLEVVPYKMEYRLEMNVWFQFMMASYRSHTTEGTDDILKMCGVLLEQLPEQTLRDGIDITLEAERLAALVDGLAFQTLFRPERLTEDRLKMILIHHLNGLFTRPLT